MLGFTIAELFMLGGFIIGILYAYFRLNLLPKEWDEWKKNMEVRITRLEQEDKSKLQTFYSVQASLKSLEDRLQKLDNHLSMIMNHLLANNKGEK